MRVGQNPFKRATSVKPPCPVTVAMLVCIPFATGYFREGLDVLKLCLRSLYKNTDSSYDLLIFDNGSNDEVVDFLRAELQAGRIQYLVLSETNVGKIAALNFMFGAAPGQYIAYADADIFFFSNWLSEHLRIMETFPDVGMVNGMPARHLTHWATEATVAKAESNPQIILERGHLLPTETIASLCEGVGRNLDDYLREHDSGEEIRLTCQGVQAYIGAHHFQFVARKDVLQQVMPLQVTTATTLVGLHERQLDEAIDRAGFLRLSTARQCSFHLGNVLTPKWRQVAEEYAADVSAPGNGSRSRGLKQLLQENPMVKRVLLKLYGGIFDLYYSGRKHEF